MKILALESSCDETAAAVVEDGVRILGSAVHSQVAEHAVYGGVVPEIASRRHTESIVGVTRLALEEAGLTLDQADAVAVTFAPGLVGALLVGVSFAKGLALAAGKPLIAVHHLRAHIAANYLAHPGLRSPFVCLVASGGHSHLVMVQSPTEFRVLGRTVDDAAGEAFDKAARVMGLGYPGGVHLDRAARRGDPSRYALPEPRVEDRPLDMSFSGLKTAVINIVHNASQRGEPLDIDSLAAALESRVADMLARRLILAARQENVSSISIAGGVSANTGLRALAGRLADENGLSLFVPPLSLCGDNAAMVGAQAFWEWQAGNRADMALNARATLDIPYRNI